MNDLFKPLSELNDWLKSNDSILELIVVGAFALHLHKISNRMTMDIDTISKLDDLILDEIELIGNKYGLTGWINNQAKDIILPEGFASRLHVYNNLSHLKIRFASRLDLILLKIAAYYYRFEQDTKDLEDLKLLAPSMNEIEQGIEFLLKHHYPDTKSFQIKFEREVEEAGMKLKKYFYGK